MRHGKPAFTGLRKVTSGEMADWVAKYNRADTGSDTPPNASKSLATRAQRVISSPLPRAISSLRALGCEADLVDEVFREAELPLFTIPGLRLAPSFWAALFRVMWLCGISRQAERLTMAKKRAAQAAGMLASVAEHANGPVLLMGHGIMNRLIARELTSLGWKEHCRPEKGYWSAGVYKLQPSKS